MKGWTVKKVKIFWGKLDEVEEKVNEWLSNLTAKAKVTHISQNTDPQLRYLTLTIFYTE